LFLNDESAALTGNAMTAVLRHGAAAIWDGSSLDAAYDWCGDHGIPRPDLINWPWWGAFAWYPDRTDDSADLRSGSATLTIRGASHRVAVHAVHEVSTPRGPIDRARVGRMMFAELAGVNPIEPESAEATPERPDLTDAVVTVARTSRSAIRVECLDVLDSLAASLLDSAVDNSERGIAHSMLGAVEFFRSRVDDDSRIDPVRDAWLNLLQVLGTELVDAMLGGRLRRIGGAALRLASAWRAS